MSQLIKLQQRVKTIKTIQKITHAMRLVSMSIHSHLNTKAHFLKNYQLELNRSFAAVDWEQKYKISTGNLQLKKLIILVWSQKGLCGAFNQDTLRKFVDTKYSKDQIELMVIGKKLIDIVQRRNLIVQKITKLSHTNISSITNQILNYITKEYNFAEVIFFSNYSKSFFSQVVKITNLLPLTDQTAKYPPSKEAYYWEQEECGLSRRH